MNDDLAVLGRLFTEITNRSKGGFFVIRETRWKDRREFAFRAWWYAKARRADGALVAVKGAQRRTVCEQLLAKLQPAGEIVNAARIALTEKGSSLAPSTRDLNGVTVKTTVRSAPQSRARVPRTTKGVSS